MDKIVKALPDSSARAQRKTNQRRKSVVPKQLPCFYVNGGRREAVLEPLSLVPFVCEDVDLPMSGIEAGNYGREVSYSVQCVGAMRGE